MVRVKNVRTHQKFGESGRWSCRDISPFNSGFEQRIENEISGKVGSPQRQFVAIDPLVSV